LVVLGVDGRIILKLILGRKTVSVPDGFIWLAVPLGISVSPVQSFHPIQDEEIFPITANSNFLMQCPNRRVGSSVKYLNILMTVRETDFSFKYFH
jgi:hypothetical protein